MGVSRCQGRVCGSDVQTSHSSPVLAESMSSSVQYPPQRLLQFSFVFIQEKDTQEKVIGPGQLTRPPPCAGNDLTVFLARGSQECKLSPTASTAADAFQDHS